MTTVSLEEIEANPDRYKRCSNGVIRDGVTNRFVRADQNTAAITSTNSQRMTARRWELARQAASAGLANVPGMQSDMDTISLIFEKQGAMAADTSRGRASTHAAEFVMTKGGYTPDRGSGGSSVVHNTLNVIAGSGLADLLQDIRDVDVVDME